MPLPLLVLSFAQESTGGPTGCAAPEARVDRAAFVYLVHSYRVDQLVDSLASVFKFFNNAFRYPILLFHEPSLDTSAAAATLSALLSPEQLCLVRWLEVTFSFPPGFDAQAALDEGVVYPQFFPGYHHMCAFWASHVFSHPAIRGLDYYVRLDTDSQFTAPITYDFIRFFKERGFEYGYRFFTTEPPDDIKGLWDLVLAYVASHNLTAPPTLPLPAANETATASLPMYYNNFEVFERL